SHARGEHRTNANREIQLHRSPGLDDWERSSFFYAAFKRKRVCPPGDHHHIRYGVAIDPLATGAGPASALIVLTAFHWPLNTFSSDETRSIADTPPPARRIACRISASM